MELQLGRVLDRHDALLVADEAREHVEQRRLSGAGAAADDPVQPRPHAVREEVEHRLRHRAQRDEVVGLQPLGREPANREQRAVHGERRNDRVDARSVRQARVHHRRAVVHAATDGAHDAIDDAHQVPVVLERRLDAVQRAPALHEDMLVRVDQDVAHRRVAQERLERPEAEHVVDELGEERLALAEAERRVLFGEQLGQQRADLALGARAIDVRERLEVQPVEQLAVDIALQLEILLPHRWLRPAGGRRSGDGRDL